MDVDSDEQKAADAAKLKELKLIVYAKDNEFRAKETEAKLAAEEVSKFQEQGQSAESNLQNIKLQAPTDPHDPRAEQHKKDVKLAEDKFVELTN